MTFVERYNSIPGHAQKRYEVIHIKKRHNVKNTEL